MSAIIPATAAERKYAGALQKNSRYHWRAADTAVVSAMAPATRAVLTAKYVMAAADSGTTKVRSAGAVMSPPKIIHVQPAACTAMTIDAMLKAARSEEHTSELQSPCNL